MKKLTRKDDQGESGFLLPPHVQEELEWMKENGIVKIVYDAITGACRYFTAEGDEIERPKP